jgi:hypothetical protein
VFAMEKGEFEKLEGPTAGGTVLTLLKSLLHLEQWRCLHHQKL